MDKPHIGQLIYYVPDDLRVRDPQEIPVTKVGKKYFECGYFRFLVSTWRLDGGGRSSAGRAYPSKYDYEGTLPENEHWKQFRAEIIGQIHAPAGISTMNIKIAARVLGFKLQP